MNNQKYLQMIDAERKRFLKHGFEERFYPEKYKEPIWFHPNEGKFLYMDRWQEWDVFDMLKKGQITFIKRAIHQGEWMLKYLYVHIDFEIDTDLIPTLILYRKKSNKRIQSYKCAFCYGNHVHGIIDGHRGTHCGEKGREKIISLDGAVLYKKHGYIIRSIND